MYKKLIGLTESKLKQIIRESVNVVLKESQSPSVDPYDLARDLYNSGIDFYEFVHHLEKAYEIIQNDHNVNSSDARMKLVQAIKKSKTFIDMTGGFEGKESGDAELIKPIRIGGVVCKRIGYGIDDDIYFYGYSDSHTGSHTINVEEYQIPQIIKLIR